MISVRQLMIFVMLVINIAVFFPQEKSQSKEKLIKRNIAILPFNNQNKVQEFDYLGETMRDTLKSELLKNEKFNITSFAQIDSEIRKKNFSIEDSVKEANAKDIALKSKSDIAVIGKYIIIKDNILVQIDAVDIFTGKTIESSSTKGSVGLDIFRIIDDVTRDMAAKLSKKLSMVDKAYFDEMMKIIKKEQSMEKIKKNMANLNNYNIAGIALVSSGSFIHLAGLIIFVVDNGYVLTKRDSLLKESYSDYVRYYEADVAMFSVGLTLLVCGGIMDIISIPLFVYKKKEFSFNLEAGSNLSMSLRYKF